jgi:hypothetical protein
MSSDNIAIRVRGLGKKYTLDKPQENYLTLRDAIVNSVKAPFVCCEEIWHTMKPGLFLRGDINA